MKKNLPVSYFQDVIIPSAFGIFIVLIISAVAFFKYGLGTALVYAVIFSLIVAGLCCISFLPFIQQIKRKGGKK
jgi:uncharacterized YccA/Bax inhibitor family protein